ncbi:Na+/H+ antiporter, partial [Staphylococcus sp. EG-SA-29]|nr:Na+/H+ antiporter [Staphylococcus sp. EG-SA-29]
MEIVIALGVAILLGQMTATRVRLAPPIVLMVFGVAMNLIPSLRQVGLPAEIVL